MKVIRFIMTLISPSTPRLFNYTLTTDFCGGPVGVKVHQVDQSLPALPAFWKSP